jgi:hypothetical protein
MTKIEKKTKFETKDIIRTMAPGSNLAFLVTNNYEKLIKKRCRRNLPYILLKTKVISDSMGFGFSPNFFLFDNFNTKIVQLIESGIARKIVEEEEIRITEKLGNFTIRKKKEKEDKRKVLRLEHLGIWFQILLILLSAASGVFAVEWIVGMVTLHLKTNLSDEFKNEVKAIRNLKDIKHLVKDNRLRRVLKLKKEKKVLFVKVKDLKKKTKARKIDRKKLEELLREIRDFMKVRRNSEAKVDPKEKYVVSESDGESEELSIESKDKLDLVDLELEVIDLE